MNEYPEYTVYYPISLALDDTVYSSVSCRIVSLEPVPDGERRKGDKWPLWRLKSVGVFTGYAPGLCLDRSSRISAPGGATYEYRDFPRLAAKMANDELERILGAL